MAPRVTFATASFQHGARALSRRPVAPTGHYKHDGCGFQIACCKQQKLFLCKDIILSCAQAKRAGPEKHILPTCAVHKPGNPAAQSLQALEGPNIGGESVNSCARDVVADVNLPSNEKPMEPWSSCFTCALSWRCS